MVLRVTQHRWTSANEQRGPRDQHHSRRVTSSWLHVLSPRRWSRLCSSYSSLVGQQAGRQAWSSSTNLCPIICNRTGGYPSTIMRCMDLSSTTTSSPGISGNRIQARALDRWALSMAHSRMTSLFEVCPLDKRKGRTRSNFCRLMLSRRSRNTSRNTRSCPWNFIAWRHHLSLEYGSSLPASRK